MIRTIVVPNTATAGDADALNTAIDLATNLGAHLLVLEIVNLPVPATGAWGFMPDAAMSDVYQRLRARAEDNVTRIRAKLEPEPLSSDVGAVEALFVEPYRMAAHCAHAADLVVVAGGGADSTEAKITHSYFASLLLESGRPVLVVPPRCDVALPPRHVVVGWRPGREATRAVHDSLPLLVSADTVDVLVVEPAGAEPDDEEDDFSGADIVEHLARHGVVANWVVRESHSQSVASVLLEHAQLSQAQLIVVGGYGHSRLREWAVGGVTRELLSEAMLPVLYSH
ncbi:MULTISPECIES: universal stress protein [unclassified Pseudoxanthomonas]|uniref:universal stress protein n=1 Tax=unclassified Pseudoxanthomonas TaxID=2645906 RepID=UPI0030789C8B